MPPMTFADALKQHDLVLTTGSTYERLRRDPRVGADPDIAHGSLIYDPVALEILRDVGQEYVDVALERGLPMLLLANTWRCSRDRVERSAFADRPVNADNMAYSLELRGDQPDDHPIFVGGTLGPRGDAYKPEEGMTYDQARSFHRWQADELAAAGAEMLFAMTLPALPEARGLADAMTATGLPTVISFVVRPEGTLLDGAPLDDAIARIDDESQPLAYWLNCTHPVNVEKALERCRPSTVDRIIGLKANASAKRPEELEGHPELLSTDPADLARHMRRIQQRFGLRLLGGCCGTNTAHLQHIAETCR